MLRSDLAKLAPHACRRSAPRWIRTTGLSLRRGSLYPAELSGPGRHFVLVGPDVTKNSRGGLGGGLGLGRIVGLVLAGVEALARQLQRPAGPQLHLHEDVVAVGLEGVEGDQAEAVADDLFLVDGRAVDLGGGSDGAADEGSSPDQGDRARAPVLAAPAADHVVVQVDFPVRVVLGEDVGEVGGGAEVGGVALTSR